jgi:hypothetical protein
MIFVHQIKIINDLLRKIKIKEIYKPLGRWNIDYCQKKINKKVDLSNEDHCGPCGKINIEKNTLPSIITKYKMK